ncbi:NAD(P)H-dependent oxidoreductase [Patescibacteria group bacterium]|nr:MAG: NAD(P)H-dependent oxidoreductase [Patescibacteria group bacterium]
MTKNIKLIIGSTRQNRIAPAVAEWVTAQAAAAAVTVEILDLKELNLPAFDAPVPPAYAPTETEAGKTWAKIVTETDAFIFLTAEYNRSIPSSLKNAIDYLAAEWKGKPAAIVSYGYVDGGQSATNHLIDIFSWLKLDIIQPTVNLQIAQTDFDETGAFTDIDTTFAPGKETLAQAFERLK